MAKNRPTQRLQKGIREAVIFSQRKGKAQRFMFDTVINREDSEDTRKMLEDIANERRLGVKIKPNYCQIGLQNQTPPFEQWAQDAITRLEPGDRYFVLVKTDNAGNTIEKALFKNENGVPVSLPLEKRADNEWEQLVRSIPRGQTGKIDIDETHNYETAPALTSQGFPSVSQSSLEPVRDTEIPMRKDKIPNLERQVDTEIPTTRSSDVQKSAPQSNSGFSAEEIAAAEFGIPPAEELQPSNTSQIFREDVQSQKSSDSTLMPEETDYSDKTEKDARPLSPSQTTVLFRNDVPAQPTDDDLQLSEEEFDLSDDDSEAVVDLEGELGNTRHLTRTPTGKLITPEGEKLLDASAPLLKPVSSDTEMVPALKPREPTAQETIRAHLDSLDNKKEDGYFGRRGEVSDDLFVPPRSITREVEVPKPQTNNMRKDDIPFQPESSKVLGKSDIPASSDSDDLSGGVFTPPGSDTEMNMSPVSEDEFSSSQETDRYPPVNPDSFVLVNEVPPVRSAPRIPPKSDRPGISAPKNQIEKAMRESEAEEKKIHENKLAHVQKVIQSGKDAGLAFVYRDLGAGELGFLIPKEFAAKLPDTRFVPPAALLDILDKAKIEPKDFALTEVYAAGGSTYESALKFSPEFIESQIFAHWSNLYFLKIQGNSALSEEDKKNFIRFTGIGSVVESEKSSSLKKSLDKSGKKVASLQSEVDKYHKLGSYEDLAFASGRRPSKIKRYAAAAVLALVAGVGGYFLNNSKAPVNNSDLESKLAQVTTERDAANSKYDKLSKEYQIIVNSENDLKSQLDNANKEKSALENAMKSAVSKEEFDSLSKQYESLKLEEQRIKAQLDDLNKEKSSLESLLESERKNSSEKDSLLKSQKSEYESQLSAKDNLINELNEKYSTYVPKETLDEWVQKFSDSESRFNDLRKEMDSLKAELDKYKKLGKYDDLKGIVEMPAVDSEKLRKAYLSQLESFSVTDKARGVDDELNRNILSIRLTKYTLANEYEAQVWLRFMDIMKKSDDGSFGSREQAPFVASVLVGAMKNMAKNGNSKYDESALNDVISKYKSFKGSGSDDKTCLSAAELTEEHFRISK